MRGLVVQSARPHNSFYGYLLDCSRSLIHRYLLQCEEENHLLAYMDSQHNRMGNLRLEDPPERPIDPPGRFWAV